jgi:hypothetical protein
MVSRNQYRSSKTQQTSPQPADQGDPADDVIIAEALSLYGSEAAAAVAFCGLEAWFEEEVEFAASLECFAGSGIRMAVPSSVRQAPASALWSGMRHPEGGLARMCDLDSFMWRRKCPEAPRNCDATQAAIVSISIP